MDNTRWASFVLLCIASLSHVKRVKGNYASSTDDTRDPSVQWEPSDMLNFVSDCASIDFEAEDSLCSDHTVEIVRAKYLESCIDVKLPVSMTSPQPVSFFLDSKEYDDDSKIACMVDYAMSSHKNDLMNDLISIEERCFPPRPSMYACEDLLGPSALSYCSDETEVQTYEEEMSFSYDYQSFSMSMTSYSYPTQHIHEGMNHIYEMCRILEKMNTDKGISCILQVCDLQSISHTSAPTLQPTPSMSTNEPTPQPSPADSSATRAPTRSPSKPPSVQPSLYQPMEPSTRPSTHNDDSGCRRNTVALSTLIACPILLMNLA